MSSASLVPETIEITGDSALRAVRHSDRRLLFRDSVARLRWADGFSHSRAMAFQLVLALIPGSIVVVALASELHWGALSDAVVRTARSLAPGPTADVFGDAVGQGATAGRTQSGWAPLLFGGVAMLVAGTTAFGQLERAMNRIYGIEADRSARQKYGRALLMMLLTGPLLVASVLLVGIGSGHGVAGVVLGFVRWSVTTVLLAAAVAMVFRIAPRRRQPTWSWLMFGSLLSVTGCVAVSLALRLYLTASASFGDTYGPLAGFIGVLLWAYAASIALFFGVAFAAQLEAVRAGVGAPRSVTKVAESEPDATAVPYGTAAMHPVST